MKYKNIPISEIVIYKHPLIYFELVILLLGDLFRWLRSFIVRRLLIILALLFLWGLLTNVSVLKPGKQFIQFAFYWVILGIASSIGLGTGLHTFVLYLGPHIAKVTIVATACGHLPEMLPSRWNFEHFGKCHKEQGEMISFFGILLAVQLQSFLWGLGTALGELPPYFVAKKAADTNEELKRMELEAEQKQAKTNEEKRQLIKTAQEIDQIHFLKSKPNKTLIQKAKITLYDSLQRFGFITILLCASIPNPLFDLAGITCGHFRIPFKKFFTATFIGKAIIKVHLQMLFVITAFRKQTVKHLIAFARNINASVAEAINSAIQKQRENLHHPKVSENEPLIGKIWNAFIILMVGYFVLSIVTSQVQEKAVEKKDKE